MGLSSSNILKLLQVKGLGRTKVFQLNQKANYSIGSNKELKDFLLVQSSSIKWSIENVIDLESAFAMGENLFELSYNQNIKFLSYNDDLYPQSLKEISTPPILLNYKGNVSVLTDYINVAVIGTRDPSEFGKKIGERIGMRLAESKINVVSGLALGCDTAAHVGALKAKGVTTAILAHGLDTVYPKSNLNLAIEILENNGCLISEYFIKTPPLRNFFVERDRIQAGLSKATIVIETDIKGGTMHAVNATLDNKRILAVYNHPSDKLNDKSRGNQYLLSEKGALGIQSKEDIENFLEKIGSGKSSEPKTDEDKVFTTNELEDLVIVPRDEYLTKNETSVITESFFLEPEPPKQKKKSAAKTKSAKKDGQPKASKPKKKDHTPKLNFDGGNI